MNYFTSNTNEMKRKVVNFSMNVSRGLKKTDKKFVCDMLYGLAACKDIKITNVARELHEKIKLDNTVERLCLHLDSFKQQELVLQNYNNFVRSMTPKNPIAIYDDSDVTKINGKKFEDIGIVKDASDPKEAYKPGYKMCNAVVLSKNTKQPIPVYSHLYSSNCKDFVSSNTETYKSIDAVRKCLNKNALMVFDRGYDDQKLFNYVLSGGDDLLVRLKKNRKFIFKDKLKKVEDAYDNHKGKIKMHLMFEDEEQDVYLSYTRATLPADGRTYTLIFVYGLSDTEKFILLTNKEINECNDVIKYVRLYLYRWRIETYHKSIKDTYNYEDFRVRGLNSMNNLTLLFNMLIGFIANLTEEIDNSLLTIKIIVESQSLRKKVGVWINQLAVGIHKMLRRAQTGIASFLNINDKHEMYIQLSFEL